jgi:hypothetical protein
MRDGGVFPALIRRKVLFRMFCDITRTKVMKVLRVSAPVFMPDATHIRILQTVADKPGCSITHVVQQLIADHGENAIRTRVHQLIDTRALDEGKSSSVIVLRITSKGRVFLQQSAS